MAPSVSAGSQTQCCFRQRFQPGKCQILSWFDWIQPVKLQSWGSPFQSIIWRYFHRFVGFFCPKLHNLLIFLWVKFIHWMDIARVVRVHKHSIVLCTLHLTWTVRYKLCFFTTTKSENSVGEMKKCLWTGLLDQWHLTPSLTPPLTLRWPLLFCLRRCAKQRPLGRLRPPRPPLRRGNSADRGGRRRV